MKIFYSWQSDLANGHNRGFIKKAIENVVEKLNQNLNINDAERDADRIKLDHDTKGITGTPDLAGTIFEKIKESTLFIADISYVAKNGIRKLSNPNVLIELGFALAMLGSDKVICILNTAHGTTEDLPFDLKHKRHPIQYLLKQDSDDKEQQKASLEKALYNAIHPIIQLAQSTAQKTILSANPSHEDIFNVIMSSDSKDDWKRQEIEHLYKNNIYYKSNVNLRFEISYTDEGLHLENFEEEWANKHPDKRASSYWCVLYFNSTIIKTFILVSVDGSRALLPLPKSSLNLTVEPLYYKVAQIHDPTRNLDEYMVRSGLRLQNIDLEAGFSDGSGFGGGSGTGAGHEDGSG